MRWWVLVVDAPLGGCANFVVMRSEKVGVGLYGEAVRNEIGIGGGRGLGVRGKEGVGWGC